VTRNRSLDDFLDAGDDDPESGGTDEGSEVEAEEATTEPSVDPETVDPVEPTLTASTDGGTCGVCGATVGLRWRDGERYVCAECKEW
jgi:hypothetical protein